VIDEKYNAQFYITSLDGKVGQVYPFEEWTDRAEAGVALHLQSYEEEIFGPGELLRANGRDGCQGRLLIPQLLREAAQLKGEVAVEPAIYPSRSSHLEAYRTEIEEQPFTPEDEKTLDDLGI